MLTRLAHLAARRPKQVVIIAVLFAVVAGALGGNVASRLGPYGDDDPATESSRVSDQLAKATGLETGENVIALVEPASRAKAAEVTRVLRTDFAIGAVASYWST